MTLRELLTTEITTHLALSEVETDQLIANYGEDDSISAEVEADIRQMFADQRAEMMVELQRAYNEISAISRMKLISEKQEQQRSAGLVQ